MPGDVVWVVDAGFLNPRRREIACITHYSGGFYEAEVWKDKRRYDAENVNDLIFRTDSELLDAFDSHRERLIEAIEANKNIET